MEKNNYFEVPYKACLQKLVFSIRNTTVPLGNKFYDKEHSKWEFLARCIRKASIEY